MQHIWQFDSPKGFASAVTPPPPELASGRLMKQWEAAGVFWRPETPKDQYPGRITFTPGAGTSVILEENLFKDLGHIGTDTVPTLHGRLFDGTPCSLFSCQCFVDTYAFDGQLYFRTKCFSDLSVVGGWWPGVDAHTLKSLRVRFSHLDHWFKAPYNIRHTRDRSKSLLSFKSDKLTADFIFKEVEVHLESLCELTIPDDATPEGAAWPFHYDVLLHPKTEQSIQWFLDLAASLRDLFVFLIGSGVYILDLVGKDKDTPPISSPNFL